MPEYISERKRRLSIGIPQFTENNLVLDVTGNAYLSGNLGIGSTNPSSRLSFGDNSFDTIPSKTSLKLYDSGDLSTYGFGVNDDSDYGGNLSKNLDIVINDENAGKIRFFVGNSGEHYSVRKKLSIGTDTFYVSNVSFLFDKPNLEGTPNQLFEVNSGAYFSGSLGVGVTNSSEKLSVDGNILISNTVLQGSIISYSQDLSDISIHSDLSSLSYRFIEYNIQATQGNNFQFTKILALHDGNDVYTTEYGNVYNNFSLGEYDIIIIENVLHLIVTPSTDLNTKYAINFIATKI